VVSCIPAVASWHDSDRVRRPPAAVAAVAAAEAVAVAAAAVAAVAVAAVAVVAETVACTAPLSAPCWKTTTHLIQQHIRSVRFFKSRDWVHRSSFVRYEVIQLLSN
jgi:hypothetical protein